MPHPFQYLIPQFDFFGQEFREIHTTWLERKEKEEQRAATAVQGPEGGHEDATAAELPAGVETPVALTLRDLPIAIDVSIPSSTFNDLEPPSIPHDVESPSDPFTYHQATTTSSPTLSVSTISDFTPTELGDDIGGGGDEQMATRHDTFYFEDGNVEIVCGRTLFRVHSTTVSFSSPKLREILSQSALLHAPMPEGCPRITVSDTAQDFWCS